MRPESNGRLVWPDRRLAEIMIYYADAVSYAGWLAGMVAVGNLTILLTSAKWYELSPAHRLAVAWVWVVTCAL